AQDHERLPLAQRAATKRDQFASSQPRTVKQFEDGKVSNRGRFTARRPILGRFENPADFGFVENSRQWPLEPGPRQCARRVVVPKTLVHEKPEEPPQRGRSAGNRRRREVGPSLSEPRKGSRVRRAERSADIR